MNTHAGQVQVWRWRIEPPGPHLTLALPAMEEIRRACIRIRRNRGDGPFPESFHGAGSDGHRHAFWLPEDEDGDGLIDHIIVFCANGIDAPTISCLAAVRSIPIGSASYRITPSWMGPCPSGGPFGPARHWTAVTPYVTPRWRLTKTGRQRPDSTPQAQLVREIKLRGLQEPEAVDCRPFAECGEDRVLASQFVWRRSKSNEMPPGDAAAAFAQITFGEPVMGPLAFGYAAHFGMGVLVPVII